MTQPNSNSAPPIPGYDYGTSRSAVSPVSTSDLAKLEQTVGWTEEDGATLARHAGLFQARAEYMVDEWRAIIGSQPHLVHSFVKPDGNPDDRYKSSVNRRFVQWVAAVATCKHDEDWRTTNTKSGCVIPRRGRTKQMAPTGHRSCRSDIS